MGGPLPRWLDRLRRPDRTGPNRCFPCAAVDLGLLAILVNAVILVGWPTGRAVALGLAGLTAVVGSAGIYLRGHLVPGTPRLSRRLLPEGIRRWFGAYRLPWGVRLGSGAVRAELDGLRARARELDAVRRAAGGSDILDETFHDAWRSRMNEFDEDVASVRARETLSAVLSVPAEALSVVERDGAILVERAGSPLGFWPTRASYLADIAASELLLEGSGADPGPDLRRWSERLAGLRLLLERCPRCSGRIQSSTGTADTCCRTVAVRRGTCVGCGDRLYEVETGRRAP